MVFSSLPFLFFYLPAVLAIYALSPLKLRNLFLLLASLFFYGWGEPVYISIMVLSIAVDYTHGRLVERWRDRDKLARAAVASSVVCNLGILIFFKYWDFIAVNVNSLTGLALPVLGLPLPIGISFYTFQTMSYTIDVYRRDAPAQRDAVAFGAYVTLFPQLIAGPIVQYKTVAEQLLKRRTDLEKFASGIQRFTVGLAKKVLLANAAGQLWDAALAAEELTACGAWLGLFAYAFQIYFDFSGYSDMAIGLGRMFGFGFPENFHYPYISRSVVEFWKRWHISLTTWFREYVYFPLGGNRVPRWKWVRNILVVWVLTGVWHGAGWNFLLWGLYYAGWMLAERLFLGRWLEKL
ncbi:MAG: MBOAT family protein, partial [Oscillospiraceae bacterium]|nr:MBOAT family protein [Oscillospiraceae bacterium]